MTALNAADECTRLGIVAGQSCAEGAYETPRWHDDVVDVSLRQVAREDAEFLYQLHRAALGDLVVSTWGPWDDRQQRELHDAWFDPTRLSVIVCNRRDVGVLDVQRLDDGVVYIARMELMPEHQGRGIGTRVVEQLIDDARRERAVSVDLDVLDANVGARRLYERLGFEHTTTTPPRHHLRLIVRVD
jgi:ribosomal protein S18 acetylase RimI-like enzyme